MVCLIDPLISFNSVVGAGIIQLVYSNQKENH